MQYHNYILFSSNPELHTISQALLRKYKKEFLKEISQAKNVVCNTYATLGLKKETTMLIWFQADSLEAVQDLVNALMHTKLGYYLSITYTLFGMTRQTQYSEKAKGHLATERKGGTYLIIYPFSKTKEWYMHDFDSRRNLMGGHVAIGKKYQKITQLLLYSYGVDDNEFVVSYETDDLSLFQSLVMELRTDKVRMYTLKDTPIFTCIYKTPEQVLTYL